MAILHFELSNRRFFHELSSSSSVRKVAFDADIPWPDQLDITGHGPVRKGVVGITCNDADAPIGSVQYLTAWRDSDTKTEHPHLLAISTKLPAESFDFLLNANLDNSKLCLTLYIDGDAPFTTGYAPDGSEQTWDVEQSNPVKAIHTVIAVLPLDKMDSAPLADEHEERNNLTPSPVLIADPQVVYHLRAIWWSIVIIGGLILAKLYLGR